MARIGLLGCGTVASYGHLPAIARTPGLELAALLDPDPVNLAREAERYGIADAFTDPEAFFACDLDAVTITSPAPCHLENIRAAARAGKHVLCEKPLAMDEAECREAIAAAENAGVMLFTGFDYRFSPAALRIRDLVREKAIGDVLSLRLVYIWNCHGKYVRSEDGSVRENARRAGRMDEGGPMVDCGVHQIDLARFWLGSEAVNWTAHGAWVDEYDTPDHVYLHMDHDNGAHTMVEISYSYCHTCKEPVRRFTYELIGTRGLILYDRENRRFEMRNEQGTEVLDFAPEKNFDGMYAAFAKALEDGGSDVLPTGLDGLMAAKISREATEGLVRRRG